MYIEEINKYLNENKLKGNGSFIRELYSPKDDGVRAWPSMK